MPFHTIPHCSGTGQVFQAFHSVPPLRSTVEHLPLLQMWYKEGRLVITGNVTERKKIVREFHDPPTAGHPGIAQTKDLIAQSYWWPQLQKDVEDYVKGYASCQANKINTHTQWAPLYPVTTQAETQPFQTIALDFITKLPLSDGHDTILTITD